MFLLLTYPLFAMWGTTNFVRRKADLTFTEKICKETKTTGLSLIKFYLCNINEGLQQICRVCYLIPDFLCGVQDVPKKRVDCCVGH